MLIKYHSSQTHLMSKSANSPLKRTRSNLMDYEMKVNEVVLKRQRVSQHIEKEILLANCRINIADCEPRLSENLIEVDLREKLRMAYNFQENQELLIAAFKDLVIAYDIANEDVQSQNKSECEENLRIRRASLDVRRELVDSKNKILDLKDQLSDAQTCNGILVGKLSKTGDELKKKEAWYEDCCYHITNLQSKLQECQQRQKEFKKHFKLTAHLDLYKDFYSAFERAMCVPQNLKDITSSNWYNTYCRCFVAEIIHNDLTTDVTGLLDVCVQCDTPIPWDTECIKCVGSVSTDSDEPTPPSSPPASSLISYECLDPECPQPKSINKND